MTQGNSRVNLNKELWSLAERFTSGSGVEDTSSPPPLIVNN